MAVAAGCGQPRLRVCLETNWLSVGSDILYVVSYHLLCVRGRAGLLLLPRTEKKTSVARKKRTSREADDVSWTDHQKCRQHPADGLQSAGLWVVSTRVPVACFTIKLC